jgi:hypothetical protein
LARPHKTCRSSPYAWPPNGDIFAEGVDELIYGRLSNVL